MDADLAERIAYFEHTGPKELVLTREEQVLVVLRNIIHGRCWDKMLNYLATHATSRLIPVRSEGDSRDIQLVMALKNYQLRYQIEDWNCYVTRRS